MEPADDLGATAEIEADLNLNQAPYLQENSVKRYTKLRAHR